MSILTAPPRAGKILAALAVLAAMMGADGGCQRTTDVQSDRPPAERGMPERNPRTAVLRVTEATGPWDLFVRASRPGSDLGDYTRDHLPGGSTWESAVHYESGDQIEIIVKASGHADDIFACEITDGARRDRDRAAGQAYCTLTTSQ